MKKKTGIEVKGAPLEKLLRMHRKLQQFIVTFFKKYTIHLENNPVDVFITHRIFAFR